MNDFFIVLQQCGILTLDSSERVKEFSKKWDVSPLQAVIECHIADENVLADSLAEALSIQRLYHLDSAVVEKDALSAIPYRIAKDLQILPIMYLDEYQKELEVVLVDPFCRKVSVFFNDHLDCSVRRVIGSKNDVLRCIDHYYPLLEQIDLDGTAEKGACV